jgi:hypothetical protein
VALQKIKGRKEAGLRVDFFGLLGSNIGEKRRSLGWFFLSGPNWSCKREDFFLLLDNYSSKAGFLSSAAFGRRFLLLFSVFFFISYFQFVLEDD